MCRQGGEQITRMNRKHLARLQSTGIGGALIAIERTYFASDVTHSKEVQHHFLTIDIDITDFDPARQQHHHAVTGLATAKDDIAFGKLLGVATADQGVERCVRKSAKKGIVPEKGTNSLDQ